MENPQLGILPVAILDDDPTQAPAAAAQRARARRALDARSDAATTVAATDVVIAMPSAPGRTIRDVRARRRSAAGLTTRTVPGLYEILSGEKRVNALRQIEIQDLLRRDPIKTDIDAGGRRSSPAAW